MKLQHTGLALACEAEGFNFLRQCESNKLQPFVNDDTSAGMEYELQVAVEGDNSQVDLPITLCNSKYYKNVKKRIDRGDLSTGVIDSLHQYIYENEAKVWENSWVQLPEDVLSAWTRKILEHDFLADKGGDTPRKRSDVKKFWCQRGDEEWLRVPISYLLKLSLAETISRNVDLPEPIFTTGKKLMDNLVSDNTSPEILSFTIPHASQQRIGELAASETARTYFMTQLLIQFANRSFNLLESGQKCHLYFAPHAPIRQKALNDIVPDGYYRHLFMSPCLSGWDKGEEKHKYMEICHKVLSRSQLNTISKLKDAGIITNNLITLPNTSNTCLANNGIHVSLGSRLLTKMANNPQSGFTPKAEKYVGDLVIKIVEHFLPLFVGTYSAAPFRLDFSDFHPESVLGYLPHELDYTHLRMVWRRWKKKAKVGFLGRAFTPFGPRLLDNSIASVLGLKGDLVPDFRLIDYFVSNLSTETSPSLNGVTGNHDQLKEELMEMGVFDSRMSIYLLYRQRESQIAGYSGFEGRSYSLFPSIREDMAKAVDMQNLITALAYKYVMEGDLSHHDIPDIPSIESERRQVFFCSAIGIPTFYVRLGTPNLFLRKILQRIPTVRNSNRYKNYLRVKTADYTLALLDVLREDGAAMISDMGLVPVIDDLEARLRGENKTAFTKIVESVTSELPGKKDPLKNCSNTFNECAEHYFRKDLKRNHMLEGIRVLLDDCKNLGNDPLVAELLKEEQLSPAEFVEHHSRSILEEKAGSNVLQRMVQICLAVIYKEQQKYVIKT